ADWPRGIGSLSTALRHQEPPRATPSRITTPASVGPAHRDRTPARGGDTSSRFREVGSRLRRVGETHRFPGISVGGFHPPYNRRTRPWEQIVNGTTPARLADHGRC